MASKTNDSSITILPNEEQMMSEELLINSLSGLCEQLNGQNVYGMGSCGPEISQVNTMFDNNRWYLISNLRQLLSQVYVEHGIVQTLVDQPVDDAFRAGFEVKSAQLDANDVEKLLIWCERNRVIHGVMQAIKWARLYGGGAVLIVTDQDYEKPLDISAIKEDSPLEFRPIDMWELFASVQNVVGTLIPGGALGENRGDHYDYYGRRVHKSRVFRVIGKEAPAFIKPRLRGWGMSELERLVRSLNQYLKNQDLIFQLLDEAKVDVYKIKGFNAAMLQQSGTNNIAKRIQKANQMKSFNSAITMDAEDDYIQKQITFAGLADVLLQIRQGIAADLKMPMTKLFGISAAGFSSGEDDIENYNSMIEGEIRNKNKFTLVDCLMIASQKVFGFMPDDLMVTFNPLRILNAKEEEEVKDSQFNRVMAVYNGGLADAKITKKAINKDSLIGEELDENSEALPPIGLDVQDPKDASGKAGKQTPQEA